MADVRRSVRSAAFVWFLAATILASWTPALLANFPAVMSPDSMDQWGQALSGTYSDWHPLAYTLVLSATMAFWPSPFAMVLVQATVLLAVIAWGLVILRDRLGSSSVLLVAVAAFFSLLPVHSALVSTLWKDVPYAAALLAFTLVLLRWFHHPRRELQRSDFALLAISALALLLLRHNGLLSVAAGFGALLIVRSPQRKPLLLCGLAVLVAWTGWRVVVREIAVSRSPLTELLALPLQQTAAVISADGRLTADQRALASAVLPLEVWRERYNRYSVDPLKFHPGFDSGVIAENRGRYLRFWTTLAAQNPRLVLMAWIRQTLVIWHPRLDGHATYPRGIVANRHDLQSAPLSTAAVEISAAWQAIAQRAPWVWLTRPGIFHAGLVLAAAASARFGGSSALLPFAPWAAGVLGLFLVLPTPDFRYFYPGLLAAPFLLAHAWRCARPAASALDGPRS